MKRIEGILIALLFSITTTTAQVIDVTDIYSEKNHFFPDFERVGNDLTFPYYRISSLVEDQFGYLWIGTRDRGLIRYDGYDFTSYKYNPNDSYSLLSNDVLFVFEDTRNVLWVGTDNGLSYFHPLRKQFIQIRLDSTKQITSPRNLICITEDFEGNLLLGTNIGVFRLSGIEIANLTNNTKAAISSGSLHIGVQQLVCSRDNGENQNLLIRDLFLSDKGTLWVLSTKELGFIEYLNLQTDNNHLSRPVFSKYSSFHKIDDAQKISPISDNGFFINNGDSIFQIEQNETTHIQFITPELENKNYLEVKGEQLYWVGYYDSKLSLLNPKNRTSYPLTFENEQDRGLNNNGVSCFLKTRSGVIFIGTAWGGLYKYNPFSIIENYHPNLHLIHHNQNSNLRFVLEDSDGYLWIVAEDIYRCNKNTGEILLTLDSKFLGHDWSYTNKIIETSSGAFLIGTESRGLILIDIENDFQGSNPKDWDIKRSRLLANKTITSIFETADQYIYASAIYTNTELNTINTEIQIFSQEGNHKETIKVSELDILNGNEIDILIYQIYVDKFGSIWLATGEGLVKINKHRAKQAVFKPENRESGSNRVLSICPDPTFSDSILWVGYAAMGLQLFNTNSETMIDISKKMSTNHIASIISDKSNNLWLGTDMGITQILFDTVAGHDTVFLVYSKLDGLITTDFTNYYGPNAMISPHNKIIFTGSRGFQVLNPRNNTTISYKPEILLTDFTINYKPANFSFNESIMDKSIVLQEKLELPYDKNTLGFEITAIDFRSPLNLEFAYKLSNYDDVWIESGNQRNIQYTKLPPGNYTLNVKVSSRDGSWIEEKQVIHISIANPWYTSTVAYIIYVIIIIGGIIVVDRIQRSRHNLKLTMQLNKVEADKLREMDQVKSKFFANISHEFKTPLTLILNPVEEMLNKSYNSAVHDSLVMIKRNARRLQDYINEILELSKIDSQRLRLKIREVDIVMFLKYQIAAFESLAKNKNINLKLNSHNKELICYLDPDKVGNIMTNLLSNAVKFTPTGGKVEVTISGCACNEHDHCSQKKGCLIISVKDSGIGIPENKIPYIFDRYYKIHDNINEYGTGLGLALVKELMTLHNGTINVVSKVNKFTLFQLHFPMGINHYRDEEVVNITRYEVEEDYYREKGKHGLKPDPEIGLSEETEKIVLLIEDNEDMRALIYAGLKRDFKVLMARDGEEGIEMALETCPDLIICDVMMPKKDGFEVARTLKLNELTSHVPIIILTAKSQVSDKITGLETGADDYLIKPFMPLELKTRIKNLIYQREKLRNKFSKQGQLNINNELVKPIDQVFLEKVIEVINTNLKDENFSVSTILTELGISRTQLHRKLKALINQSANELIQSVRLQKASDLLKQKAGTVSEICYEVGFNSPPTFTNLFKKHFGHTPSEHMER